MKYFWFCVLFAMPSLAIASPYSDFNAGIAAMNREDAEAAMTAFNAALSAPDLLPAFRTAAYFDRSRVYVERKQWDLAIADLTAALKIDPEYLDAYDLRSEVYKNTKHFDLGIADLATVISRRPSLASAYARRAVLYSENDAIDNAIADANTVVRLSPLIATGYELRGRFYHKKGDIENALADDKKAIDIAPRSSAAYYDRGAIFQERGDFERAASDFARLSEIDPKNAPARFRAGLVAWELGKFGDALQAFSDTTVQPEGELATYNALWRWIAATKVKESQPLPLAKQITNDEWPKPILDLYEGKGSIEALMKSSKEAASGIPKDKVCEANFYGGVWQEIHADKSTAIAMLSTAASGCPSDYIEHIAASAELKRLQ